MIKSAMRNLARFAAGASAVIAVISVTPAHAERIISDYEASKLTLESLTAAPAYHPVVYHIAHHKVAAANVRMASTSRHATTRPMVRFVSFKVVKKASAHSAPVRRRHT